MITLPVKEQSINSLQTVDGLNEKPEGSEDDDSFKL